MSADRQKERILALERGGEEVKMVAMKIEDQVFKQHEFAREKDRVLDLISANPKVVSDEQVSERVLEFLGRFQGDGWLAIENDLYEKRRSVFRGVSTFEAVQQ